MLTKVTTKFGLGDIDAIDPNREEIIRCLMEEIEYFLEEGIEELLAFKKYCKKQSPSWRRKHHEMIERVSNYGVTKVTDEFSFCVRPVEYGWDYSCSRPFYEVRVDQLEVPPDVYDWHLIGFFSIERSCLNEFGIGIGL